jgi:DNA polymerase
MSETLAQIAAEIAACQKCPLYHGRTHPVPGAGKEDAEILFIGEGPGFNEDQQGLPFVGASGKFLESMLGSIGLTRRDVFIANVVKCRPPENRDPLEEEIAACRDYLDRQIDAINPSVIVTLGRFSMARYFPGAKISAIHGRGKMIGNRMIVPFFHPAAALHQPNMRESIMADFALLPGYIEQVRASSAPVQAPPPEDDAQQLSLF